MLCRVKQYCNPLRRDTITPKPDNSDRIPIRQKELTIRHAQHTREAFRAVENKLVERLMVPRHREGVDWIRRGVHRFRKQLHIPFITEKPLREAEEILE